MWEEYFPNAELFGIDIRSKEEQQNHLCVELTRTKLDVVDQSDASALVAYAEENGPFDVIIDDGSHITSHQILSFETLWPHTGGIYVVEDTLTSYVAKYLDSEKSCVEYFKDLIDEIHLPIAKRSPLFRDIETIIIKHDMIVVTKRGL